MSINLRNREEIKHFFDTNLGKKPGLLVSTRGASGIDDYYTITLIDALGAEVKSVEFLDVSVGFESAEKKVSHLDVMVANKETLNNLLNELYEVQA